MADTTGWPRQWTAPQFKTPSSPKVARFKKRLARDLFESRNKADVRRRDGFCRFPLCGCRKMKIADAVAHTRHKGSGGNPAGDRSAPELMILLCACRHRENVIALDRGTLRIRPLNTHMGYAGPCAFDVDLRALNLRNWEPRKPVWVEIARETARHVFEPFTPDQQAILAKLATMER